MLVLLVLLVLVVLLVLLVLVVLVLLLVLLVLLVLVVPVVLRGANMLSQLPHIAALVLLSTSFVGVVAVAAASINRGARGYLALVRRDLQTHGASLQVDDSTVRQLQLILAYFHIFHMQTPNISVEHHRICMPSRLALVGLQWNALLSALCAMTPTGKQRWRTVVKPRVLLKSRRRQDSPQILWPSPQRRDRGSDFTECPVFRKFELPEGGHAELPRHAQHQRQPSAEKQRFRPCVGHACGPISRRTCDIRHSGPDFRKTILNTQQAWGTDLTGKRERVFSKQLLPS